MAFQITGVTIVCSAVNSGTDIGNKIKAPRHRPFLRESTDDRWIPLTKGQQRGKCFHFLTSSCILEYSCVTSRGLCASGDQKIHVDVITWQPFLCLWPYVRGVHQPWFPWFLTQHISDVELWFLCSLPEQKCELVTPPMRWDAVTLMWLHYNMCHLNATSHFEHGMNTS